MPFEIHFDEHCGSIAHVRGRDEIDFVEWRAAMEALRARPGFGPDTAILLDVREATNAPPRGTYAIIADAWSELAGGHRVAIVAPGGSAAFGVARQVSIVTGGGVLVYSDLEDALRSLPLQKPLK